MSKQQIKPANPVLMILLGIVLLVIAVSFIIFGSGSITLDAMNNSGISGQLVVAFITGITTGGLSCLAVQGGLLASTIAHQIEKDISAQVLQKGTNSRAASTTHTQTAIPILLFLIAKLGAYTFLGALLGWLGSYLTLSPMTRAMLMIAIGIFMIGNALRIFNVHPIFRYFSIEPPKFITRYIRKTAKGTDTATPLFLGALTVFIPCGVTQAMMATALGTGNPGMGAALMFAFILGTSPVFFIIAYLTTELGARMEKFFMRFVATVVLILGLVTMNGGLNLVGSPLSFNNLTRGIFPVSDDPSISAESLPTSDADSVLYVRNEGYFPQTINVPAGQPLTLNLVTDKTYSCARDFVIPALNYYQLLPETGTVQVDIPAQSAGTRMNFTCSMGMYTGQIVFE